MTICAYKHEEIVHDERHCPLCEANDMIKELEKLVSMLEDKIKEFEND